MSAVVTLGRNYREESELRRRWPHDVDWERDSPEACAVLVARYFPSHPRLHAFLDTFQDYRVAFFRHPHRVDHHCHLQTVHVEGGHLRQILGVLTGIAKYRRLESTTAWARLRRIPEEVRELQRHDATPEEIYQAVLDTQVRPFLAATGTGPALRRVVMQTHYSDHNHITSGVGIVRTRALFSDLVAYLYLPVAVELDVWSEDLLEALRTDGMDPEALGRVRARRQLIIAPIEGRARPETLARLQDVAARARDVRAGQLGELAHLLTREDFVAEVLREEALALSSAARDFVLAWSARYLALHRRADLPGSVHPLTVAVRALELFLLDQVDRIAEAESWAEERRAALRDELQRFLPAAKRLMRRRWGVAQRLPRYLDALRSFSGECLVFEPHPAAEHFDTGTITNQELLETMLPVYRRARAAGLTGLELNRGENFNDVVLEVAERLGLHLSIGSDSHSLSFSRSKRLKRDREFGCPRSVPSALFRFPGRARPVMLSPLEVARAIGRLVDRPVPDNPDLNDGPFGGAW